MLYPPVALERAMTIREVVLRAMSGEITWIQAAEIIGCTPRSVRRWRGRFARDGYFRPARPPAGSALAAAGTVRRGRALLAALPRAVCRFPVPALLSDRA